VNSRGFARVEVVPVRASSILTRTSGYLADVTSHSLNPYRGCGLGRSLCGVGCYVQHNVWITRGKPWGSFVEAKRNAAELYRAEYECERRWARRTCGRFGVFLASSTEPFQPAESAHGITSAVLHEMTQLLPDALVIQTHSHRVLDALALLCALKDRCALRVHISIETDRDAIPGGPKHASPVEKRVKAGAALRRRGVWTIATISPLLPIENPQRFFARLAIAFDAVVIDHFVEGDGSPGDDGSRTRRTPLPQLMHAVEPRSVTLGYRDEMVAIARRYCANVGVGREGFAGRYL
jgi:DNA repair photolyase